IDPGRGWALVSTNRLATVVRLIPREEYQRLRAGGEGNRLKGEFGSQTGTPFGMYRESFLAPSGGPSTAPPWGTLAAVDLATGAVRWEIPLGRIPQLGMVEKS